MSLFRFQPRRPLRLVVLISGGGTTLRNLLEKITAGELDAEILHVISSNGSAGGLRFAEEARVPADVIQRSSFVSIEAYSAVVFDACRAADPDLVVMGGFLKLLVIPPDFENRVLNIHPALIPAFCGKGFYGHRVHEAVLAYGAKLSGCTVHFVDNRYDHGPILLQRAVPVLDDDSPQTLAARVFEAECDAYPEALRLIGEGRVEIDGRMVRLRP
ncbi:MAG TPA: phosphoribosylglycinamide formyltransferase [Pirellulales bacterium]|jgi:formyltetrahydrofolate-dependent phosphoribosylglycinamide formyltransferase|nr:phosphoribosylglycinamide formyltransferase [Pirellulales bacterium]